MASDNQSCLRFSVEESVWFQKGQEVSELVSITLDPDIVIQEHDQYVSIRGALQLSGEYRIDENRSEDEEPRDYTALRVVNQVTTREDGVSELKHRFPVDVTIPKNRIQNLDDVYVAIDSFDYELPRNGCLQLVADLSISGIYGSQQSVPSLENEQEDRFDTNEVNNEIDNNPSSNEDELSPFVATREWNEQKEDNTYARNEVQETEELEELEEDLSPVVSEQEDTSENDEPEEESDLYTPFEIEGRKEAYHEDIDKVDEVVNDAVDDAVEEVKQPVMQIGMKSRAEDSQKWAPQGREKEKVAANMKDAPKNDGEHEQQASGKRSENALYLTKIFARDDDEDFTKMKICIAQQGDTLDIIAERYEVNVQHLLRVNDIDLNHDVSEGQLLYIPVTVSKK
ncbi:stage VI sporulation protein D [Cytobacillus suaedae]|nr:stage VI sporulation protein D [Cytobacillus suaedae]